MTRIMYDSVTAADIPASATMVAGYVNGTFKWSAADWARFPRAVKVRIATQAYVNDGNVLDVEKGDATPAQAPGWVLARRAAGVDPTVYCGAAALPSVQAAFTAARVPQPHYWVARYDNVRSIPAGTVAKQFTDPTYSGGHYDLSIVADFWPGIDGPAPAYTPTPNTVNEEDEMEAIALPASPNTSLKTIPWNGRAGVLNVIATDTDVFVGRPLNWGPNGGTGGGDPTNPALPTAGNGWRVAANLPGAFTIPAGTTRVLYSWSCNTPTYVWPVAN